MPILDFYNPSPAWYLYSPYSIHGIGHAARVLIWVDQIGQAMIEHGMHIDIEVTRWSAILHDIRRADDDRDPLHGQRAAEWIEECYQHRLFSDLNEHQVQQLMYCCVWHVPDDVLIPQITAELMCLKDADGLDRFRLNDLNLSFLRTSYARSLCHVAQRLSAETNKASSVNVWASVRASALQMGIWR